jgi:putative ABC transport system substrate-binding protein
MITRRDVLAALPGLSAAWLEVAQAQRRTAPKRVASLELGNGPENPDPSKPLDKDESLFWEAMRKRGWNLGDNIVAERAYANWNAARLPGLAAELVRKRVDLIFCADDAVTVAAARATQSIPILFGNASMPVELGFVESLSRPGRNLTGTAMYADTGIVVKRLEFLRAIVPGERLSWLWSGQTRFAETVSRLRIDEAGRYESAARGLGFDTRIHLLPAPGDIEKVFAEAIAWKAQAITGGGWAVYEAKRQLAQLALRSGLPLANHHREYVEAGGLLSYGPSPSQDAVVTDALIDYMDRILRGAKPSELPVIQPNRYELVINVKTARTLGLTIPRAILARADELMGS